MQPKCTMNAALRAVSEYNSDATNKEEVTISQTWLMAEQAANGIRRE